jgi:hypothetical protein
VLSSPVFANPHPRSVSSLPLPRALRERRLPRPGPRVKISPPRELCRFATTTLTLPRQLPRRKQPKSARFSARIQNPLLCFQQLAHSSAIRWGWGVGSRLSYLQFRVSFLDLLYLLCLPLLRDIPFFVSRKFFICHSYANCRGVTFFKPIQRPLFSVAWHLHCLFFITFCPILREKMRIISSQIGTRGRESSPPTLAKRARHPLVTRHFPAQTIVHQAPIC